MAMRIYFRTAAALNFAKFYETAVLDGDIRKNTRIARAVEDAPAANDDVIVILFWRGSLSVASRREEKAGHNGHASQEALSMTSHDISSKFSFVRLDS